MQTTFEFTLPRGYIDAGGQIHRTGVMRLATALDEIGPMRDQRVQTNQAYLVILLLSQVITRLGELERVTPAVVEALFSADLAYLQDFYRQVNEHGSPLLEVACPHCERHFQVDAGAGGA